MISLQILKMYLKENALEMNIRCSKNAENVKSKFHLKILCDTYINTKMKR